MFDLTVLTEQERSEFEEFWKTVSPKITAPDGTVTGFEALTNDEFFAMERWYWLIKKRKG